MRRERCIERALNRVGLYYDTPDFKEAQDPTRNFYAYQAFCTSLICSVVGELVPKDVPAYVDYCADCGDALFYKRRHLAHGNPPKAPRFECSQCGFSSLVYRELIAHMKRRCGIV